MDDDVEPMTPNEMLQAYLNGIFKETLKDFDNMQITPDLIANIQRALQKALSKVPGLPEVNVEVKRLSSGHMIVNLVPPDDSSDDWKNGVSGA
jgi:hypothetical protein